MIENESDILDYIDAEDERFYNEPLEAEPIKKTTKTAREYRLDYLLAVACQRPRLLRDVIESEALPDHQSELQAIYNAYKESGDLPSSKSLELVFGLSIETTDWDETAAYNFLEQLNERKKINILSKLAEDRPEDIDSAITKIQKKYKTHFGSEEGHLSIGSHEDLLAALIESEDAMQNNIKTGFTRLARVVSGDDSLCWFPGSLYTIMGLPGYGKSIFLANFARDSLEQGYCTLYISTEMSKLALSKRIAKSYYQITNLNELSVQKKTWAGHLDIFKVHPGECTYLDIQSIIDNLDRKPDIVYIDYADELKAHERYNGDYEAQGIVYTGLKTLAEKNNVPVITATQTNRSAEGDSGGTKDYVGYAQIADSTKKIRLVDILGAIVQSPDDKSAGIINLHIIKNRNGETAKLSYYINYQKMLLTEREGEKNKIEKPSVESQTKTVSMTL